MGRRLFVRPNELGFSKSGLSTRIHSTVDSLGNPIGLHLTDVSAYDLDSADVMLPQIKANIGLPTKALMPMSMPRFSYKMRAKATIIPPDGSRKVHKSYD